MTFDFVQQVKSRAKSIQLDKASIPTSEPDMDKAASHPDPSKRTCSLPPSKDGVSSEQPLASGQAPMRRYKSMLEVDEPPKLRPWNPMSFDELYSTPINESGRAESVAASSDRTEVATRASTDTIKDTVKDLTCQGPPFAYAHSLSAYCASINCVSIFA